MTDDGRVYQRVMEATPNLVLQGPVAKLVNRTLGSTEAGTFDRETERFTLRHVTNAFGERVELGGTPAFTQAFGAPWSATCPPPPGGGVGMPGGGIPTPCCRLAQDVDFVILLNQNADPTEQASSYGSNMLSLIEDGICQVEANNAWPNVPTSPSIPWAP